MTMSVAGRPGSPNAGAMSDNVHALRRSWRKMRLFGNSLLYYIFHLSQFIVLGFLNLNSRVSEATQPLPYLIPSSHVTLSRHDSII